MRIEIVAVGSALVALSRVPMVVDAGAISWIALLAGVIFLGLGITQKSSTDITGEGFSKINSLHARGKKDASKTLKALVNHMNEKNMSVEDAFRFFDINADGHINHFEFEAGLKNLGIASIGPPQIAALINALDEDENGTIEIEELRSYIERT
tara:strand:+ start:49 stop:507 length:459 start_codon:yes stop_codon:yes gene_type:complete